MPAVWQFPPRRTCFHQHALAGSPCWVPKSTACCGIWQLVPAVRNPHLVFSKSSAVRRLAPPWSVLLAASPACHPAMPVAPLPLLLLPLLSSRGRGAAEAASRSATMFADDT